MDAWINSLNGVQFVGLWIGGPVVVVGLFSGCLALYFWLHGDLA
jgi:hypothetical protein